MIFQEYYIKIAQKLVNSSCRLQDGDKVYIEIVDGDNQFLELLLDEVISAGAIPFMSHKYTRIMSRVNDNYSAGEYEIIADNELNILQKMDAFIGITYPQNIYEMSSLTQHSMKNMRKKYLGPVHYTYRNNNLKWVFWRHPTEAMAQRAKMSYNKFVSLYMKASTLEYSPVMGELSMLQEMLGVTKEISISGDNGTDLRFNVEGIPNYLSLGEHNIPDGELLTAPQRYSANGCIRINVPTTYHGKHFREIYMVFENGAIVDFETDNNQDFRSIINQDNGSRYLGEFAIGFNNNVKFPIDDILFDEKMLGSIHIALGNCYRVASNNNKSDIHWDLILDMRNMKNSLLSFDGQPIIRNGKFVLSSLAKLNTYET